MKSNNKIIIITTEERCCKENFQTRYCWARVQNGGIWFEMQMRRSRVLYWAPQSFALSPLTASVQDQRARTGEMKIFEPYGGSTDDQISSDWKFVICGLSPYNGITLTVYGYLFKNLPSCSNLRFFTVPRRSYWVTLETLWRTVI